MPSLFQFDMVPNKATSELKNKLRTLIENTVDENCLTANLSLSHKLKLLELALNYTLPKLAHTYKEIDNKQKTFRVEYVPSLEEKDNS